MRRIETAHGPLSRWVDNTRERDGTVTYDAHYRFEATGEHLISHGALRFRSGAEIERDLHNNGFVVRHRYGDWDRTPTGPALIFVATAQ